MHSGRHSLYTRAPKPKRNQTLLDPLIYILSHVKRD